MTPEAFVSQIASAAAALVTDSVKTILTDRPPPWYDVTRQTAAGPVQQKVQLPQMIAELTDAVKVNNDLLRYFIGLQTQVGQVTEGLKIEMEKSRKKRGKRKSDDEEEEE